MESGIKLAYFGQSTPLRNKEISFIKQLVTMTQNLYFQTCVNPNNSPVCGLDYLTSSTLLLSNPLSE